MPVIFETVHEDEVRRVALSNSDARLFRHLVDASLKGVVLKLHVRTVRRLRDAGLPIEPDQDGCRIAPEAVIRELSGEHRQAEIERMSIENDQ